MLYIYIHTRYKSKHDKKNRHNDNKLNNKANWIAKILITIIKSTGAKQVVKNDGDNEMDFQLTQNDTYFWAEKRLVQNYKSMQNCKIECCIMRE